MRVLHGVAWYLPESVGGTEQYVRGLCAALAAHGVESHIVAPADKDDDYSIDGVPVHRFSVPAVPARSNFRTAAVPDRFKQILHSSRADLFHLHSITRGIHQHFLRHARESDVRTVHTMHTATPVCLTGTLLRNGAEVCDGEIRDARCAKCWLRSRGHSPLWAAVGKSIGATALRVAPGSRLTTALATRADVANKRRQLSDTLAWADRTVLCSRWQVDTLLRNGADGAGLRVINPGIEDSFDPPTAVRPSGPVRICFVGRVEPIKGLDVLVDALAPLLGVEAIELEILAVLPPVGSPHRAYADSVLDRARSLGARVELQADRNVVARTLAQADIVAIPSRVLETGPLVAMEALAVGASVVGSALGGIAERASDGIALVDACTVEAWRNALRFLIDSAIARRLTRRPVQVRRMADVALEYRQLYAELQ